MEDRVFFTYSYLQIKIQISKGKTHISEKNTQIRINNFQVENDTTSPSAGEWSEVAVPVPYMDSFSSSWFYTFPFLQSGTVYDVVGLGNILCTYYFYTKSLTISRHIVCNKNLKIQAAN